MENKHIWCMLTYFQRTHIYYLTIQHALLIAHNGSWHFYIQSIINISTVPEKFMGT